MKKLILIVSNALLMISLAAFAKSEESSRLDTKQGAPLNYSLDQKKTQANARTEPCPDCEKHLSAAPIVVADGYGRLMPDSTQQQQAQPEKTAKETK